MSASISFVQSNFTLSTNVILVLTVSIWSCLSPTPVAVCNLPCNLPTYADCIPSQMNLNKKAVCSFKMLVYAFKTVWCKPRRPQLLYDHDTCFIVVNEQSPCDN